MRLSIRRAVLLLAVLGGVLLAAGSSQGRPLSRGDDSCPGVCPEGTHEECKDVSYEHCPPGKTPACGCCILVVKEVCTCVPD